MTTSTVTKGKTYIEKYAAIYGINTPEPYEGKNIVGFWNKNYLPIAVRIFAFQLVNNSLAVGARLGNRYVRDVDRQIDVNCMLCKDDNYNLPIRETFRHLFFECKVTNNVFSLFRAKYLQGIGLDSARKLIFLGITDENNFSEIHLLVSVLFLFCVWKCRASKKISFATVENNMEFYYSGILKQNRFLLDQAVNSNYEWCRHWYRGEDDHGEGQQAGCG